MDKLPTFSETEPVASIAVAFSVFINAVIVALPLLGIPLDWEQQVAIAGIINAGLAFFTLWQRSKVYSPHTVEHIKEDAQEAVKQAYKATPGVDPMPRIDKAA